MSNKDNETLLCKTINVRIKKRILYDLLDEDTLKNKEKINWIVQRVVEINNIPVLECLILRGIKWGILNKQKQTGIHIAVYKNYFEAANLMFPHYGTSINYIDNRGLSHFHAACIIGNVEIAEKFLIDGVDVNSHFYYQDCKQTPLHVAVRFNHVEIVELLLKYGAWPNALCSYGRSPMHFVCCGNVEEIGKMMSLLVCYKAGYWEDHSKLNYIFYKKFQKEMDIKKYLIEYGGLVNMRNNIGDTALHSVFKINHFKHMDSIYPQSVFDFYNLPNIIEKIRNRQKRKIDYLLTKDADVTVVNDKGNTILHLAIKAMKEFRRRYSEAIEFDDYILAEMVRQFLAHGADVNAKNKKGQSPLELAVASLYFETVTVLLNSGADATKINFNWFQYNKDMLPCLTATENLINIVDALENKGLQLDQKKNLNILKFLVKNNSNYSYAVSTDKEAHYKIKNLLQYGTDDTIKLGLQNFSTNTLKNKDELRSNRLKRKVAIQIYYYLMILERGNLYASQELKDFLWQKINSSISDISGINDLDANIMNEFKNMRNVCLSPKANLREILNTNPQNCYWRIINSEYMYILDSKEFKRQFYYTWGIIKGHFAKTLIRHYVVESARDNLRILINLSIPDEICDYIFDYLSNESLFDVCVAVVKQKRS